MSRGSGAREEIEEDSLRLIRYEEAKCVFYGVEALWERELPSRKEVSQERRAVLGSIVRWRSPLSERNLSLRITPDSHRDERAAFGVPSDFEAL